MSQQWAAAVPAPCRPAQALQPARSTAALPADCLSDSRRRATVPLSYVITPGLTLAPPQVPPILTPSQGPLAAGYSGAPARRPGRPLVSAGPAQADHPDTSPLPHDRLVFALLYNVSGEAFEEARVLAFVDHAECRGGRPAAGVHWNSGQRPVSSRAAGDRPATDKQRHRQRSLDSGQQAVNDSHLYATAGRKKVTRSARAENGKKHTFQRV